MDMEGYGMFHRVCPKCRSVEREDMNVTTMPVLMFPSGEISDNNQCYCRCGWSGIVNDLIPAKSEPSPAPWKNDPKSLNGIIDANGAVVTYMPFTKSLYGNRALVIEAVNAYVNAVGES
jgi:hypothetical protein